jgi:hypothetical protein
MLQIACCSGATLYLQFRELPKYSNEIAVITSDPFAVITSDPLVETRLSKYKDIIGDDFDAYRNHIYRVLSYSLHFLGDQTHRDVIASALVYHDIGLWTTNSSTAYLQPSVKTATAESIAFSPLELEMQEAIILNHHKILSYTGPHSKVVEAVRKADWVDSYGFFNKNLPRIHIRAVKTALPDMGFYAYKNMAGFGPHCLRLHADVYTTLSQVVQIFHI